MPSSSPRPMAPFLRLPDELLLRIVSEVDDDTSATFRHLALTHGRFRRITNEALICNGTVSIRGVPKYLELLSGHQSWIPRITRIKLLDSREKHAPFVPRPQARNACRQFILDLFADNRLANRCNTNKQTYELWVLVLLAIVPAKCLDIAAEYSGFHTAGYHELLVEPEDSRPRLGHANRILLINGLLKKIRPRIEELSLVKAQGNMCIAGTRPNTWRWTHLKMLSLSGGSIPLEMCPCGCEGPHTRQLIPDELQVLRIYCDAATAPWMLLHDIYRRKNRLQGNKSRLPDLRRVEVFFKGSASQVADYTVFTPVSRAELRYWARWSPDVSRLQDILERWEESGVMQWFFPKIDGCTAKTTPEDYERGDLMQAVRLAEKGHGLWTLVRRRK